MVAQLDDSALAPSRANLAAQASQLQHRLEELTHGARREEIAEAQAQLAAAEALRDQAQREYLRTSQLLPRGLIAQSQVDQDLQARDSSAASARAAQAALALLKACLLYTSPSPRD